MSPDVAAGLYRDELDEWRAYNAVAALPEADLVHLLSAHQHSQRPAVVTDAEVITYSQLRARAAGWVDSLRALGLEQGARVGVLASRNGGCYPLIYACLWAGFTYVPLDEVAYGVGVGALAARAQARVIVGSASQTARLRNSLADVTLVSFDDVTPVGDPDGEIVDLAPGHLAAYVIYTSGTTGKPKGVAVSRRSIANLASWHRERHGIVPGDRLSQNAPLVFDPSAQQIVAAWISGASVHVMPDDVRVDPESLVRWLRHHRITHLDAVTAHWASLTQVVCDNTGEPPLPDLRWSIVAGESMYGLQATAWLHGLGRGSRLDNIYGPTEATVNATQHEVRPDVADGRVPIGRPLPGYRVYVLDEDGDLCPPGVTGELVIAGIGVALGYDGDRELTEQRFGRITVDGAEERVYHTGDLAELRADGPDAPVLFFAGRRDRQAKVSGIRIELDHVELAVASIPGVVTAVALVLGETASAVTIAFTGTTGVEAVRAALSDRLPGHIRVGAVHRLETVPLTGSGKVDTKALDEVLERCSVPTLNLSPQGESADDRTSMMLSTIMESWTRELGQPVGPDVPFSALGGTSLVAFRIVARLRSLSLPVNGTDLLSDPTPRILTADVLARADVAEPQRAAMGGVEIGLERRGGLPVLPVAALEEVWSRSAAPIGAAPRLGPLAEAWTDHRTSAMGIAAIEVQVEASTDAVLQAVARVLDAHPSLRTSWLGPGRPALQTSPHSVPVVVLRADDQNRDVLMTVRRTAGDSCRDGAATRVAVLRHDETDQHVVVIVAPHAVVDADFADHVQQMLLDQVRLPGPTALAGDIDAWWRYIEDIADGSREELHHQWSRFDEADAAASEALHDPTVGLERRWAPCPLPVDARGGRLDSATRWGMILEPVVAAAARCLGLTAVPVSLMGRPSLTPVQPPFDHALIDAVPLVVPANSSATGAADLLSRAVETFPHWIAGAVSIQQTTTAPARRGIAFVGTVRVQRRLAEAATDPGTSDATSGEPATAPWLEITDHVAQGRLEVVASGVAVRVVDEIARALVGPAAVGDRLMYR